MANPRIIPKKSAISKVPSSSDLVSGEVAVNYADQQWYGKHPSTGAIVEIGAPYLHSHDQLLSADKNTELELNNSGQIVITDNSSAKTFTLPSASGTLATLSDVGSAGQQADWNATSGSSQILNKPTLSAVATSGSYNDLTNKPTTFSVSATPPSSPSAGMLWLEEGTLRSFVYYDSQWVEFGLSGSQSYEVRHAYAAPYSYTGTAVDGTSESASGWNITRLEISSSGTTTKTTASGVWNDRASLTYT